MPILGETGYNDNLWCAFHHEDLTPTTIRLPMGVSGVTWDYNLITSVIDTYGGQVVQILGVNISKLSIAGQFGGPDPMWGATQNSDGHFNVVENNTNPNPRFSQYNWINDLSHPWTNGIMQLSDWFREYFEISTQGTQARSGVFEQYNQKVMTFMHPARGWKIFIRPTSFPTIRQANDNVAPEWKIEADYIEDAELDRSFLRDVEQVALDRLDDLKAGIGFTLNNPFSEFVQSGVTNSEVIDKLITDYQDSVKEGLSQEDIDQLVEYGFSYPGAALGRAGFKPSQFSG